MFSVSTNGKITGRRSSVFYQDVINGLRAENKYLLSKYFYDETGDKIFQQIMSSPEYYPTRCEMEIMQHQSPSMARLFAEQLSSFDLLPRRGEDPAPLANAPIRQANVQAPEINGAAQPGL